jgi:hypothetical protein
MNTKQKVAFVLAMFLSVLSALVLMGYGNTPLGHVAGLVLLASGIFGIQLANTENKNAYLTTTFLVGNAIVWLSASFIKAETLDIIVSLWVIALCIPAATMKWSYPKDVKMTSEVYFSFVGLFQFLVAVLVIFTGYSIWNMLL